MKHLNSFGRIRYLILFLLIVISGTTNGQMIAGWDFFGMSSPATATPTFYDGNLNTTGRDMTRGAGAAASAATNSFRTTGFQNNGISTANTDYFQVTLRANAGFTLSLSTIDARFNGTNTFYASPGVSSQYAYSLDGTNFTLLASAVQSTSLTPSQINISGIAALQNVSSATTIYLRYYASGQTSTGGWGFHSSASGVYGFAIGGSLTSACTPPATPVGSVTATENPACSSTTLSFPASAIPNVTYYWQTSSSGTSMATATNGLPDYSVFSSGTYYVRAYNSSTSCWSAASVASAAIVVNIPPSISSHPASTSTSTTQTATFTTSATGTGLSYQWQVNTGSGWNNVVNGGVYSNATTASLTITNPPITYNNYQYRVVVSGTSPCTPATSNAATLSVSLYCIPSITTCDEYISRVIINTINNPSPSPYNCGSTSNGYSDYSLLSTTLIKGQTYSISISVGEIVTPDPTSGYLGDDIRVWADWNQNNIFETGERIVQFTDNGGAGTYNFTVPLTATSGNVRLRARLVYNNTETNPCGLAEFGETEDYSLNITDACVSTVTVSNIYPATGPAETIVRIVGANLSGVTAVSFNNIAAASFTLVSSTVLLAEVPPGAGTGKITLTDAACTYTTTMNFITLAVSGTCSGVGSNTDLVITEISDPVSGNNHYIEVYNGTASTINLDAPDNYTIQVVNNPPGTVQSFDITGTIAPGQVKVYYAGANGGLASAPAQGTSNGFNADDEVRLVKNGVTLDVVVTPAYVGYNFKRLTSVTSPSATYNAAQWTLTPEPVTQSTSNIGTYTVPPTLTVTAPADVSSCSINMTVTASPSAGSGFQWKFQDGNTGTWTDLVNGTSGGRTISGATTASLSITGDLTLFNNYQFYVQVTNGSCIISSNAAQFTVNASRFFRSQALTGNWSAASSWQMATSSAGPWSSACTYPTASNSDSISIENGSVITLDITPITLDQITIKTGGHLIHSATTVLTISNGGTGTDIQVNGTYTDNSSTTTTFPSSTWAMGSAASYIKTNASGAGVWQSSYESGISNIPATANWIIRYTGVFANIPIVTVGAFYPNLIFESTSGAWTPGLITRFQGAGGFTTVKGKLDVGGTGSGTITSLVNENTNANPLLINDSLIIRAGSTLTNAGSVNGTGFEVKGDVVVSGTFTNNGGSTGLLRLSGTTDQIVYGNGTMNLQDLTMANTGSGNIIINRHVPVNGTLTFNTGSRTSLQTHNIVMRSTASATSRIAQIPSGVTINYTTGNFVIERFLPVDVHGRSWQFLSVPLDTALSTQTINQAWQDTATVPNQSRYNGYGVQITSEISPLPDMFDLSSVSPSMKTYNAGTWVGVPNTSSTKIANRKGYMVFVRGDRTVTAFGQAPTATTLRAAGKIYTQASPPPAASLATGVYTSVGNPFASAIDFTLLNRSATVQNGFYVWDPTMVGNYGLGGYQLISPPNWYALPGGTTAYPSATSFKNIQSGQAILVSAVTSPGTVTFAEDDKVGGNAMVFREQPRQTPGYLQANLFTVANGTWSVADGNVSAFDNNFKDGIDENDFVKMNNSGENFGIRRGDIILIFDARKQLNRNDTIHYKLWNLRQAAHRFVFTPENMNTRHQAWLVDNYTGERIPVSLTDSTSIEFSITQDPASAAPYRFFMVFRDKSDPKNQPVVISKPEKKTGDLKIYPNPVQNHLLCYENNGMEGHAFQIVNTFGQIVLEGKQTKLRQPFSIALPGQVNTGMYRLVVRNGTKIKTSSFLIK